MLTNGRRSFLDMTIPTPPQQQHQQQLQFESTVSLQRLKEADGRVNRDKGGAAWGGKMGASMDEGWSCRERARVVKGTGLQLPADYSQEPRQRVSLLHELLYFHFHIYTNFICNPSLSQGFFRVYHRYGTHPELIPSGGLLRQARNRWGKKAAFLVRGNLQECVKTSLWESGRCRKDFGEWPEGDGRKG